MDTELRNPLQAYLQRHVDYPDDKYQLPVYTDGRPLTKLYIEPDVLESENGQNKRGAHSEQVLEQADWGADPVTWHSVLTRELDGDKTGAGPCRAFVLAPPGYGKSLLLKMTAKRLAQEALDLWQRGAEPTKIPLPISIRFESLAKSTPKSGESPGKALSRALAERMLWEPAAAGIEEDLAGYLADHAHERRVWLLLDGFDELTSPGREDAANWMLDELRQWDCCLVIASRQYGHGAIRLPFPTTEYRLEGLSPSQVNYFLTRWFDNEQQVAFAQDFLKNSASARQLSEIPLLLTLLCRYLERPEASVTVTRANLYDLLLRDLLGRRKREAGEPDKERASEWLSMLPEMALRWFASAPNRHDVPIERLQGILAELADC